MAKSKLDKNKVVKLSNTKNEKHKKIGTSREKVIQSKKDGGKRKLKVSSKLEPLRAELNSLVTQANQLVRELRESGYGDDSLALAEAERTKIRFHSDDQLFTANLPRARDIGREMARVRNFLTNPTSTVEGTQRELYGLAHSLFGGQYRANGGYGANPARVTKEQADRVYEVYKNALATQGGYERVMGWLKARYSGLQDYGSEILINKIFDMVSNTSDKVIMRESEGKDALRERDRIDYWSIKASNMIEEMIDESRRISDLQQMGIDYGILTSKDREERIKTQIWRNRMEYLDEEYKNGRL